MLEAFVDFFVGSVGDVLEASQSVEAAMASIASGSNVEASDFSHVHTSQIVWPTSTNSPVCSG